MGMHSLIPKPSSPCPPHVPVRKILWGAHGGQSEEDLGMRIQDAHFQDVLISIILCGTRTAQLVGPVFLASTDMLLQLGSAVVDKLVLKQ